MVGAKNRELGMIVGREQEQWMLHSLGVMV